MSGLQPAVSERDHALGDAHAAVTLVEYGDYECPHCGHAHPIVQRVRRHFGPRLRFVFRNFPLTQAHPHALLAAEAAEAAGAQGKFWPMHDWLFEHQFALDGAHILAEAVKLRLDAERFRHDVESRAFEARVREDFTSGVRSGVNGTPTFFINGERFDGSWAEESLAAAIEQAAHHHRLR